MITCSYVGCPHVALWLYMPWPLDGTTLPFCITHVPPPALTWVLPGGWESPDGRQADIVSISIAPPDEWLPADLTYLPNGAAYVRPNHELGGL